MNNDRKFKVAVVGLGTRSVKDYLSEIFNSRTAQLVAVCDANCNSLKEICEKYVINGYRSIEDLVENETIDFVIMATPNFKKYISEIKKINKASKGFFI